MPAFLTFDTVSAHTPDRRTLFQDLTLALGTERVGLVGRNGSGKSTLLKIATGEVNAAAGTVRRSGAIGILEQDWPGDATLMQALGVAAGLALLDRMLSGSGSPEDFDAADWTLESRVEVALAEAGLCGIAPERTIGTLSGGERTRVGIARLLIERPDILLLDEPTNNLDAAGRSAIHSLLRNWSGGVLVASHDRELLETMDRIVELTTIGVRVVGGGWSTFAALRAAERKNAALALERSDASRRSAERTVQRQREAKERRDRAGRAFAATGSAPKILLGAQAERAENSGGRSRRTGERQISEAAAQVEEARSRVEVLTPLSMTLPASGIPSGAQLLTLKDVTVDFSGQRLGPWSLAVRGPERIAVAGPNGAGKSTLLRIAAGLAQPTGGSVDRAEGRIAMLDQHVGLLDRDSTILANFRLHNPSASVQDVYAACARFAFRNTDAERRVATLSGGERLRAALACVLAAEFPPWLLILDEPTNHLDIESVELLEQALQGFDGALMIVSHDAEFLKAVRTDRQFHV